MNAYILVEIGKQRQQIASDRAFAIRNGLTTQNITDWKAGKSLPTWANMEKLAAAASMELWEAVKVMKEHEAKMKQAGFATLPMMAWLAAGSLSAMSLTNVTSLPYEAVLTGLVTGMMCVMLNSSNR